MGDLATCNVENEEKGMKAGWMTMPLAFVATFAFLFVVGTSGAGVDADTDGDGVQDNMDNCDAKVNASQIDSDQDGYGNACDADFNQDGIVGAPDFTSFAAAFGKAEGDAGFQNAIDCNGDGIVGGPDFTCFASGFNNGRSPGGVFGGPGPSGRACVEAAGSAQFGGTGGPKKSCPDIDFPDSTLTK